MLNINSIDIIYTIPDLQDEILNKRQTSKRKRNEKKEWKDTQ